MQCPVCKTLNSGGQKYCKICAFDLTQTEIPASVPQFIELPSETPMSSSELFTVGPPPSNSLALNNLKIGLGIGLGVLLLMIGVAAVALVGSQGNSSGMSSADFSTKNTTANTNSYKPRSTYSNSSTPYPAANTSSSSQKTGRLVTDLNIRDAPNKEAWSLGIHFMNAKVRVLEETSYELEGEVSRWYRVLVTQYGCSKDASLGCGKNASNDADEGWVNAKYILLD